MSNKSSRHQSLIALSTGVGPERYAKALAEEALRLIGSSSFIQAEDNRSQPNPLHLPVLLQATIEPVKDEFTDRYLQPSGRMRSKAFLADNRFNRTFLKTLGVEHDDETRMHAFRHPLNDYVVEWAAGDRIDRLSEEYKVEHPYVQKFIAFNGHNVAVPVRPAGVIKGSLVVATFLDSTEQMLGPSNFNPYSKI